MVAAKLGGPDPDLNARLFAVRKRRARRAFRATSLNAPSRRGRASAAKNWSWTTSSSRVTRRTRCRDHRGADRQRQPHGTRNPRSLQEGPAGTAGTQVLVRPRRACRGASSRRRHRPGSRRHEAGTNEVEPLAHGENDDIPEGAAAPALSPTDRRCTRSHNGWPSTAGQWSPAKWATSRRTFPNRARPSMRW